MATSDDTEKAEPSFSEEFAAARRKYLQGKGGRTFEYRGKSYTVDTREDVARGKASEMARESRRSTGYTEAPKPDLKESTSGFGPKITYAPKPGAKSIYEGTDLRGVAGAAATAASVVPAMRALRAGMAAVKGARAAAAAREASKEIVRDSDRVNFKNGGLVKRATVKSHGKAC